VRRALLPGGVLLAAVVLGGCFSNEKAILMAPGSYGDIAVVASDVGLEEAVATVLPDLNEELSFVIAREHRFNIDVYGPDHWDLCKGYKNILFVVRTDEKSDVLAALQKLLTEDNYARLTGGDTGVVMHLDEPFANYQFAVVVAAPGRNEVLSLLRRNAVQLRSTIEEEAVERIMRRYRHDGLRTELMTRLWNQHRFFLEVPEVYVLNQDRPDGYQGIELMQKAPSRGLSIAWQDVPDPAAALRDTSVLLAMRREMGKRLHSEQIVPESLVWKVDRLGETPAVRLEGAWNSTVFEGGGAFWTWFVADPAGGRLFCLDALCYAPGMDKMPFFRRMRAIFTTFSLDRPQP